MLILLIAQFFHLELRGGGGVPRADTLKVDLVQMPEISDQLDLHGAESKLWSIHRLRYLNNIVVAVEEILIDHRRCSSLNAQELHESLYMHYRENFDFWIGRVEDKIDCGPAPDWASELLNIPAGTVIGRVERKRWSNSNRVEEFSRIWFNPVQCQYFSRWS